MPRASDKYLDTTYLKQYEHVHINTASAQFIQQAKTTETLSLPLSRYQALCKQLRESNFSLTVTV